MKAGRATAVAIESSGPDPQRDRLIEVCVATSADGDEPRTVSLAADATPDELGAQLAAAAPADAVWLAHGAGRVQAFLTQATGRVFEPALVDTAELARICFPTLADYNLLPLAESLDLNPQRDPSLAAVCCNVLRLWQRLRERVEQMHPALRMELARLFALSRDHPLRICFTPPASRPAESLGDLYSREAPPKRRQLVLADIRTGLDADAVGAVFAPGGGLAASLRGYEARPQQVDMAQAVAGAFSGSRFLVVEAGTGVGKSLAYLVPAVMWSALNETPVVVSTSTKNLQSQLLDKDIPLLSRVLGAEFKAVVIKGRRNYLCLRKLLFLLRHAARELDWRERSLLAAILIWSAATEAGDISECSACSGAGDNLNDEITSAGGECHGPPCGYRQRCFLYHARRKALAADVVIANHAVVLAELGAGDASAVLPPHRQIILDEAHNLEDAATSAFSVEISARRLAFLMGRLWRSGGRRGGHGLIPLLIRHLESLGCAYAAELREGALKSLSAAAAGLQGLRASADAFFSSLAGLLPASSDRETFRLHAGERPQPQWTAVRKAKESFTAGLNGITRSLDAALGALRGPAEADGGELADFVLQLQSTAGELLGFTGDIDFVLEAQAEDCVYWVERAPPRQGGACAWAAPIQVGPRLFELLYSQKESVVMTSATLSVGGSFTYIEKRLGIDLVEPARRVELLLGSPFEYPRQCAALTPMFLPDPDGGDGGYAVELGRLLAEIFRRTRGRGMGLFTSYDMLARTAAVLRPALDGDGIPLLVQGESGSREAMLDAFRTHGAAVLLGTHSFWEGVDVVGEALSCLVVARLPFAVFTDPIMDARCRQVEAAGDSAFYGFSVPNAVIKLRQGFGRLIRSRADRGLVVIADRRIISKRYGQWFRNSLPVPVRAVPDRDQFLAAVEAFFESGE